MELLEENKLLRSLQENCEIKQQDILEENTLLREEISHLTQRLQKATHTEVRSHVNTNLNTQLLFYMDSSRKPMVNITARSAVTPETPRKMGQK